MIMSPEEFDEKHKTKAKILSPGEFDQKHKARKGILTPKEFDKKVLPKYEKKSWIAKHPTLYGLYGAAKGVSEAVGKIGLATYADPYEVKELLKKTPKQQRRQLLMDTLESVAVIAFGAAKPKIKVKPSLLKRGFSKIEKDIDETGITTYRYFDKEGKEVGIGLLKGKNILGVEVEPQFRRLGYGKHIAKHLESRGGTQAYRMSPEGEAMMKRAGWRLKGGTAHHPIYERPPEPKHEALFQKVESALKEAKSKRKVQELLYTVERRKRFAKAKIAGERIPGKKGYIAQLKELKDPLPKVEFDSIAKKIGQKEQDELFMIVREKITNTGHQITAQRGLGKLFGEFGGAVPTEGELALLEKAFPKSLIKALLSKRSLMVKMKGAGFQLANIPRSIMSSFDLSAPLRQGLVLGAGHPIRFMQSFVKMFRQFGREKAFAAVQATIEKKASYALMQESGLSLTGLGKQMTLREERFMSQWAEKIPFLIGKGVRASGRAYTGFLNKLRADVFDDLIKNAEKIGRDPYNNPKLVKEIAKFVNAASGRGGLGALENSAVALNATLFSPRLIASRLQILSPAYYIRADPFVRKEALRSLFALTGLAATVLGLSRAGGAEVGLNPSSADFLKIKIRGKVRVDILGGLQQYMRATGQIISGKYISSVTGKVITLGEGYRPLTRWEIATRFGESKLAPIASFAVALLKGQDIRGQKISVPKEIGKRFVPMVMQDIYDLAIEEPDLLPLGLLGMFGVGLQVYKPRRKVTGRGIRGLEMIKGIKGIK